jgi:DEAD/DEAH box helicase domain-containing protein
VIEKVTGYKKIKFFTHENAGYGDVHLPEMEMHTTSFWLTIPEPLITQLNYPKAMVIDALGGLLAALETVCTVGLMCDPRDIGHSMGDGKGGTPAREAGVARIEATEPTLFLFDAQPGGVGLAERIFEQVGIFLERTRQLIEHCPCPGGCPACVGPSNDHSMRKAVAQRVLDELLGSGAVAFEPVGSNGSLLRPAQATVAPERPQP